MKARLLVDDIEQFLVAIRADDGAGTHSSRCAPGQESMEPERPAQASPRMRSPGEVVSFEGRRP